MRATPPHGLRRLRAGPLTVALEGIGVRYVTLGDVEIVRRMYVAIRDQTWNTISGIASEIEIDEGGDWFDARFSVRHCSPEIDFTWRGSICGAPDGRISFAMDGRAGRRMLYNRIGLCILHPWRQYAGQQFRGETPDGPIEGTLPRLVGRQRFENGVYVPLFPSVSRLEIDLEEGPSAVFEFDGDLFEMEDQRNWTDASFKTYSTPLASGFPHELKCGQRISQSVDVYSAGPTAVALSRAEVQLKVGGPNGEQVPPIGLAVSSVDPSEAEVELLHALAPAHLRADIHLSDSAWPDELTRALRLCGRIGAALEVALFLREHNPLGELRQALAGAAIARVLVVPAGAQTATADETTPPALVAYVRKNLALSGVPIAGGTDMHFCELNRTRPQVDAMDGLFWSINPQVHAFDDVSLLETPEAQGEQVRAAKAFAEGKPLFVGPVTLRSRQVVYAAADPADPRQALSIAAAWTAASVKHLAEQGAASVTYFETTGSRGVVSGGRPLPVYSVLAHVCSVRGAEILECQTTHPLEVAGFAVRREDGLGVLVANLTASPQKVALRGIATSGVLRIGPYEVAFLDAAALHD